MKKIIQFLMKIYLKRHVALLSDPGFSFDDKDYIYVWTNHQTAEKLYKEILRVLEEERTNRYIIEV